MPTSFISMVPDAHSAHSDSAKMAMRSLVQNKARSFERIIRLSSYTAIAPARCCYSVKTRFRVLQKARSTTAFSISTFRRLPTHRCFTPSRMENIYAQRSLRQDGLWFRIYITDLQPTSFFVPMHCVRPSNSPPKVLPNHVRIHSSTSPPKVLSNHVRIHPFPSPSVSACSLRPPTAHRIHS